MSKPKFGKWISVKEYLPEVPSRVLVSSTDGVILCYAIAFYNGENFLFDTTQLKVIVKQATDKPIKVDYWMPLPKQPKY